MAKQNNNNILNLEDQLSLPVANTVKPPEFEEAIIDDGGDQQAANNVQYDQIPEPDPEQEPQAGDYMPPKYIAETIVNLLDGLQSSVVPYLLENKLFTTKELEILQTIDRSGGSVYSPENSPQALVLKKWKSLQRKIEKIPFDVGEKRRLIDATTRYAETTNMKVSPLSGLLMAYSEVILKRSSYFFNE